MLDGWKSFYSKNTKILNVSTCINARIKSERLFEAFHDAGQQKVDLCDAVV